MASGGKFTKGVAKTRPGVYMNFEATKQTVTTVDDDGICVVPIIAPTYGELNKFIEITASEVSTLSAYIGYEYSDTSVEAVLLIREALKGCNIVKIYNVGTGGTEASATIGTVTATALYPGERGNAISFAIAANPVSGYDITVLFDGSTKATYEGIATTDELAAISNDYVIFSGTGSLETAITAGTSLTGGVNATSTVANFSTFLDALDYCSFKSVCLPVDCSDDSNSTIAEAFLSKIVYLTESMGKCIVGVMANYAADNQAVLNVVNAPYLDDGTELTAAIATAYVAALYAASDELTNNTNKVYPNAAGIASEYLLSNEDIIDGINNGYYMFTLSEDGEVVIEYDINSLVNLSDTQDESYRSNRIIRTFYAIAEELKEEFAVGKYSCDTSSFDVMDGIGIGILKKFEEDGALKNVSDGDFAVDRDNSTGDSAYFDVAIQPVDSLVKCYFTVATTI